MAFSAFCSSIFMVISSRHFDCIFPILSYTSTSYSHCLGTLAWRKKMFWYGDYYRSQIYAFPDWNLSKLKFFNQGLRRKFKNLAKKLSDFDKNLTTQKTICVDLLVKISSKSNNFLAKFLLWNAKGQCDKQNFCCKNFDIDKWLYDAN